MTLAAVLADPATWNDLISGLPNLILGAGVAGAWVLAYMRGWIVSATSHQEKCKEVEARTAERDAWQKLYLDEVAAHQHTREALLASAQQAGVFTDSARMVVSVIEAIHQQAAQHDPSVAALPPPPPP